MLTKQNTQLSRIESIDLLRGIVMIIMALDHVRDYYHADSFIYDPADVTRTSVLLFLTRWITHFCAPVFVLLSGTSAFLSGRRKTKKQLSRFLITRGLWLILLEITVIGFAWYFNPAFNYFGMQVIWALGISMICLAGLIYLPRMAILIIGLVLVCLHNFFDNFHIPGNGAGAILWSILHERKRFDFSFFSAEFAYPLIPWIGLMAIGYCMGFLYGTDVEASRRKRMLTVTGICCLIVFVLVRSGNFYGDPQPWNIQPAGIFSVLSFINVTKYPPSFDYLLVTVGLALIFLAYTEKPLSRVTGMISIYGKVPFFFYIIHIYLIHAGALLAASLTGFDWKIMTGFTQWISGIPALQGYGFSLGVVYLIWFMLMVILYPLCKWYNGYKLTHQEMWWLSYL